MFLNKSELSRIRRIAVIPFDSRAREQSSADIVSNLFYGRFLELGRYEIVNPGDVYLFFLSRGKAFRGELDYESIFRIGKFLKVDAVITGKVLEYRDSPEPSVSISARMISTGSGRIIWQDMRTATSSRRKALFASSEAESVFTLSKETVTDMTAVLRKIKEDGEINTAEEIPEYNLHNILAELYFHRGQYFPAIEHLQYLINSGAGDPDQLRDLRYNLGICYEEQNELDDAIDIWLKISAEYPDWKVAELKYRTGRNFRKLDQMPLALEYLLSPDLERDPFWTESARLEISAAYLALENYEKVIEVCNDFLDTYPDSGSKNRALLNKGEACFNLDQYEEAWLTLREYHIQFPDSLTVWLADWITGQSLQGMENWRDSLSFLHRASETLPDGGPEEMINYKLSVAYWNLKEFPKATEFLEKLPEKLMAIENADELNVMKGESYYFQDDFENALIFFRKTLSKDKAEDQLLFETARSYQAVGQWIEAISLYVLISDSSSEYREPSMFEMANIYYKKGDLTEAIQMFEMLAATDNGFSIEAKFSLGKLYMDENNYPKAVRIYENLAKTGSDRETILKAEKWLKTVQYKMKIEMENTQ